MLSSIRLGLGRYSGDVEVLCSWNGTPEEERSVTVPEGIELYFAERAPYHFASNINRLSERACGELLLLVNDDLVFGPNSIEVAVRSLNEWHGVGIVGAKLINSSGSIGHAGILFDHGHKPFHRYLGAAPNHLLVERTELVPATTGAFMLTRASSFSRCPMNEEYANNGEDIEICLTYKRTLGLNTLYCHEACCTHPERSTRGHEVVDQGFGNDDSEDLSRIRKSRLDYLRSLTIEEVQWELCLASREISYWHAVGQGANSTLLDEPKNEVSDLRKKLIESERAIKALKLTVADQSVELERARAELEIACLAHLRAKAELQVERGKVRLQQNKPSNRNDGRGPGLRRNF